MWILSIVLYINLWVGVKHAEHLSLWLWKGRGNGLLLVHYKVQIQEPTTSLIHREKSPELDEGQLVP